MAPTRAGHEGGSGHNEGGSDARALVDTGHEGGGGHDGGSARPARRILDNVPPLPRHRTSAVASHAAQLRWMLCQRLRVVIRTGNPRVSEARPAPALAKPSTRSTGTGVSRVWVAGLRGIEGIETRTNGLAPRACFLKRLHNAEAANAALLVYADGWDTAVVPAFSLPRCPTPHTIPSWCSRVVRCHVRVSSAVVYACRPPSSSLAIVVRPLSSDRRGKGRGRAAQDGSMSGEGSVEGFRVAAATHLADLPLLGSSLCYPASLSRSHHEFRRPTSLIGGEGHATMKKGSLKLTSTRLSR
ncbi:hypothetical protein BJ912DRAFT_927415 [Pholiota molesta]|nr:hypothetical protein BJ912DRAFT_927415 [Pholiota molesta]